MVQTEDPNYPDILSLPVYCSLCKQFRVKPELGYWEQDWPRTNEKTALTDVTIVCKIYEILKRPFPEGSVCFECYDIIEIYEHAKLKCSGTIETFIKREDSQKSKLDDLRHGLDESVPLKYCIYCKDPNPELTEDKAPHNTPAMKIPGTPGISPMM